MTTTTNYNLEIFAPGSTVTFYSFMRSMMEATGTSNMEKIDTVIQSLYEKLVFKRQGGSSSNFSTPGTNNYSPARVYIQYGFAATIDFPNGLISVTFPVAFSDIPALFIMPENYYGGLSTMPTVEVDTITASGFTGRHKKFVLSGAEEINQDDATYEFAISKNTLTFATWFALGPLA